MAKMLSKVLLLAVAAMAVGETAPPCSGEGAEGCDAAESSLMQTGPQRRLVDASVLTVQEANEPCVGPAVTTPQAYVDCWNAGKVCCIGENLLASIMGPQPGPSDKIYPPDRAYAWLGNMDDMTTGLRLRKKYGHFNEQITLGLQIAVGFNPLQTDFGVKGNNGFAFVVLEKPDGSVNTPSWSQFFDLFEQQGIDFSYDVVKNITTAYANIGSFGAPYDVVQAFTKLTGCHRECLVPVSGDIQIIAECGCFPEVVSAWNDVLSKYAAGDNGTTLECFKALYKYDPNPCAGVIRVAFQACADCLPVYTGFGIGYNTLVSNLISPRNCQVPLYDRYGGREFIIPNDPLWKLNKTKSARYINLKKLTTAIINSPTLVNDFC